MAEIKHSPTVTAVISAEQQLPEITFKAIVLAIILAIILAAANAYLGLKIGQTVSASIPAAVISMGILRLFKHSNILENNIVQTAASAGEALVGGMAFILPALIILKVWSDFNYWETVTIAMVGGILGVIFSIPLRRVLLADKNLLFPEGTAIGNVLTLSASTSANMTYLVRGGLAGSLISAAQVGFKLLADSCQFWFKPASFVIGIGLGFNPAMIAAGYIAGISVGASILIGIIIGWGIGVPVLSYYYGMNGLSATDVAMAMWHDYIRYIGVGTMMVGGLWTLLYLLKPLAQGMQLSLAAVKTIKRQGLASISRTERDIPLNYALWALGLLTIPLAMIFWHFISSSLAMGTPIKWLLISTGVGFVILVGFVLASMSGYFAGLVGSSSSHVSALTLAALLLASLLIVAVLGTHGHFTANSQQSLTAAALAIVLAAIVAGSVALTMDTVQDLKAGQMVGATPWKQQLMLILGVVVSALVLPWILSLLFNAYGISGIFPHPGMDPQQVLSAPKAELMAVVVKGVFSHQLPLAMLATGGIIAIATIIINQLLQFKQLRLLVLAVGLGIYLPLDSATPMVMGSFIAYRVQRYVSKHFAGAEDTQHRGLTLACGMVAGASLMGVLLAIPFAISQSTNVLRLVPASFAPFSNGLAILVTLFLLYSMFRVGTQGRH